jgi:hypothetical protein
MRKFVLKLIMENDAMQTSEDIIRSLGIAQEKVERFGVADITNRKKHIRDINGNVVGRLHIVDREA